MGVEENYAEAGRHETASRYHADLIRQLTAVGRMPITEKKFYVVQEFLATACKVTEADRISVYEYQNPEEYRQVYEYDAEAGAKEIIEPLYIRKKDFIHWADEFREIDSFVVEDAAKIEEKDRRTYEKLTGTRLDSLIAFRLTNNGEKSGCMIIENPNIGRSDPFIELIPLIDVFLGNVRKNYYSEVVHKEDTHTLSEKRMELERERRLLDVLCRDYTTVYHLDLIHDTFEPIKLTADVNAVKIDGVRMRTQGNYTENIREYCERYVAAKNKEKVRKIMDRSRLILELSRAGRIVYRYESLPNLSGHQYFEAYVIRVNQDHFDGNAILAFRHIDDIITLEQKHQQELEEALEKEKISNEVLSAISKIYYAILRIDLEKDQYEEISGKQGSNGESGKRECASMAMERLCRSVVVSEYQERIGKFLDIHTLAQRLEKEETIAAEYLAKDGNWHTARFIVNRRDQQGKVMQVLYVTRLISDTKRREKNWIAIAEEANRANEAKSEFISQIAHDIRTPMNAMFGFLEVAEAGIEDRKKVEYCLGKIRVAGDFMKELVNDVLDISRMENGKMKLNPEKMSIRKVYEEFVSALEHSGTGKKLTIHSDIHDIIYDQVSADPLRIRQIYSNILSNAVKYTPDQGEVDFEIYEEELAGSDKVRVVAVVRDTGVGMSEEYMERMYSKFTRETDTRINKVSGYGLGLSIVRQLVDLMGGTIDVKSVVGKGTTFCIRLDLPYIDGKEEDKEEKEIRKDSCKGMHLLIAEDNDLNYEVMEELLRICQISCERAEDGIICVEKFKEAEPHTYDGILMDMQMPNMDGVEAVKNIRRLDRADAETIPVIAMTANAFKEDVDKCINAGMNEHLTKPVDLQKLLATLIKFRTN